MSTIHSMWCRLLWAKSPLAGRKGAWSSITKGLNQQAVTCRLLRVVIFLQSLLELACDFLEEGYLLLKVVLHLGLEVSHTDLVEVLDLSQGGAGDDVTALVDALGLSRVHLSLLHVFLALFHFCQRPCLETEQKQKNIFIYFGSRITFIIVIVFILETASSWKNTTCYSNLCGKTAHNWNCSQQCSFLHT